MKKKLIALLMAAALLFTLASCQKSEAGNDSTASEATAQQNTGDEPDYTDEATKQIITPVTACTHR